MKEIYRRGGRGYPTFQQNKESAIHTNAYILISFSICELFLSLTFLSQSTVEEQESNLKDNVTKPP